MSLRCASAPSAPGTPALRAGPSGFAVIRWPVVVGAGSVSAFLVLCLTALAWAELAPRRQAAPPSGRAAVAPVPSTGNWPSVQEFDWEASGTQDEPSVEESPTLFGKAAASPPLPESVPADLVFAPGLPLSERPVVSQDTVDNCHGTAVAFARGPAEAARQALAENKLLFTLHLSGHFEDAGFT